MIYKTNFNKVKNRYNYIQRNIKNKKNKKKSFNKFIYQ